MSFNGYFLIAQSPTAIIELPSVQVALRRANIGRPLVDAVLGYRRDGNWQMLQCDADDLRVEDLVDDTHAPALVIFTFEDVVADVRAASPAAPSWFAILNPNGGREYHVPDAGPVEEVAARAVAWAAEAGLMADHARITTAIGMPPGPFSEGVDEFVAGLGLRFGEQQPIT